jgi:hypothetical protein
MIQKLMGALRDELQIILHSITDQVLTMKPFSSDILNVQLSVSLIGLFTLQKWLDLPPCPRPII